MACRGIEIVLVTGIRNWFMIMSIDESGEDYAFEASRFVVVDLPLAARKTLASAASI